MRLTRAALCALAFFGVQLTAFAREATYEQIYGDAAVASVVAQRTFAGVLPSIADYSQTAHSVLKDGEYCPVDSLAGASYCRPGAKWVMWDTPFMQFDARDGQGGYAGWDMDMSGFGTGIGRMLNDTTVIGIAVGWDARKTDLDRFSTGFFPNRRYKEKDRSDAFHGAVYGGTAIGCFFVDAYAGYSKTWHRTRVDGMDVTDPGVLLKETSKYTDSVYSAGLKASYVWILPNEMRFTSTLGFDYSRLTGDTAKGNYFVSPGSPDSGNWIFRYKKTAFNSFQTPVNFALNKTFQSDFLAFRGKPSWWTPEIRGGYVPQFGSNRVSAKSVDPDGDAAKFKSSEYDSYGTVGAGVKIKLADKYIFAVDYDYRFGRDYKSHLLTGTYGVSF